MPRGNGTGPMGRGPMTGRAAGFCAGNGRSGFENPASGRGCGFGYGRGMGGGFGRGFRNMFFATGLPGWARSGGTPAPVGMNEKQVLKSQADALQVQLDTVRQRLGRLEAAEQ